MKKSSLLVLPLLSLMLVGMTSHASAQWSTDPTVNTPICTAFDHQCNTASVSDGAGGAIIAWWDRRSGGGNIYALRINALGEVQWDANGVALSTDGLALNFTNDVPRSPKITGDGAGGAIITWEKAPDDDLYAQRVDASGTVLWTPNGVTIAAAANRQLYPNIASDGAKGAIITWMDERGGPNVFAQRVDSSGAVKWMSNGVPIAYDAGYPVIVSDDSGGAIITWNVDLPIPDPFRKTDIYAQRIDANGMRQWGDSNGIPICAANGYQRYPSIVSDGIGGAIISWMCTSGGPGVGFFAQRVNRSGIVQWVTDGVTLSLTSPEGLSLSSTTDGARGAIVAWVDTRPGATVSDLYIQRVDSAGVVRWTQNGVAICTAPERQYNPKVVSDGAEGAIVTWWDERNFATTKTDIYAQRVNSLGVVQWAVNGNPISTAANVQTYPTMVSDGVGGAIIAWDDLRFGQSDVYAQRVNRSGGLGGLRESSIGGKKFQDENGDCVHDLNEVAMPNWVIRLDPGRIFAVTDSGGTYHFDSLAAGTYTLSEVPQIGWMQTCPASPGTYEITLSESQALADRKFGDLRLPDAGRQDLSVNVGGGPARPGFQKVYGIVYENRGSLTVPNCVVTFVHPLHTTYKPADSNPPHDGYDLPTRTVTWNVGTLVPGFRGFIQVYVQIAPPHEVNNGDCLTACAHINPTVGDDDLRNNDDCETQCARGAIDPNEKFVTPVGVGPDGLINKTDTLRYHINFQNVGTDTALNVVVRDTLDSDLDATSFVSGSSSHPYTVINDSGRVEWRFTNINLPDSNVNETASHGFLEYKVHPRADIGFGTDILNHASIYFDFNPPVQTNSVRNRIGGVARYTLANGWNIISVPIIVSDYQKTALFPTATSRAFGYSGIYYALDSLRNGDGYWLNFPSADTTEMVGSAILEDTIDVREGWNMIGSISQSILTSSITSLPGGITTSSFFGYDGSSYIVANNIEPGKGYWVRVNQSGKLILSSLRSANASARIRIVPASELPPLPPDGKALQTKGIPKEYVLEQNYPNPFNPLAIIRYSLPVASHVKLRIFNLLGQEVKTLVDGIRDAGYESVEWDASSSASGVYFYRLQTEKFTDTKKMLLVK